MSTSFGKYAELANPGQGFGLGAHWAISNEGGDFAYAVDLPSSGAPEPETWTALAGGLALLRLRRYRAQQQP